MKQLDVELIRYEKLKHVKFLVNRIQFRKEHIHNEFEIFIVLKGSGIAKIKNKSYSLKAGDIFLINSGEVHSYMSDPLYSLDVEDTGDVPLFLFVQISNHCLREYFPQIRTTVFNSCNLRDYLSDAEANSMINLLVQSAKLYFLEEPLYQLNVLSNIAKVMVSCYKEVPHEIISEAQKTNLKQKNLRVERIISYIDANFETQIRLQDLAEQENLSPTHFSHLFTSLFGVTFQNYVNIKRMEQCIRLMPNKEKTLLEISYESGFSDPKYMNRMFIKHFGYTPKEYRKRLGMEQKEISQITREFETIYSLSESIAALEEYQKTHAE
ncbi:MAG: helix-turn-helix transcriptional regulator [Bacilli bacterium]|nr:helix-turn-helix transcriptional regulator [Bacilli bacterium]